MTKLYQRPGAFEVIVNSDGKSPEEYLSERAFAINIVPATELVELFDKHGITRRGKYAWSIPDTDEGHHKFIEFYKDYQGIFTPETLHTSETNSVLYQLISESQPLCFPQRFAFSNTYPALNIFQDEYFQQRENRDFLPRIPIRQPTKSFFGDLETLYEIPNDVIFAHPVKPAYQELFTKANVLSNMRGNAADGKAQLQADILEIFRSNFSPFLIVCENKRGTLWLRLKFVNYDDDTERGLYYYTTTLSQLTGNKKLRNVAEHINGLHYLGSKVPNNVSLFLSELLYDTKNLAMKYEDIFTERSKEILENLSSRADKELYVSNSFSNPNKVDVMNASSDDFTVSFTNGKRNVTIKGYTTKQLSVVDALSMDQDTKREALIHPALFDLQRMINAEEYKEEPRLYSYQRRAVGLQLSTERGFLNSLDTGIGKSIVQLTAMRERAKNKSNYRGIIACQSNTIKQWHEYMIDEAWFPEANIAIINSTKKVDELVTALSYEGPTVVLVTFKMLVEVANVLEERAEMKEALTNLKGNELTTYIKAHHETMLTDEYTLGEILVDCKWDDVCADEATVIRSEVTSKQSKALWHIRGNSQVGTALTATPFNKSISDIERLLAWVRNDKRLFHGASLASQYDQENITEKDAKKIFDTLYPMVLRFTKEEAAAEEKEKIKIPIEKDPITLYLKPSPEELALSQACEFELKRIVKELEEALNSYEAKTDAEKEELELAREELRNAHGHWLSGTNIARMATSNPASILNSTSLAAQLLISQGLVQAAMNDVPTKQKILLEYVTENVKDGKNVLVFTDFVEVADLLKDAFEKSGIRAGVFSGKNVNKRDANRIAFQKGELDVLICTKAAETGLTLHRASVTYHYDTSWTLVPLLQKAGRAARVGSENEYVETYFLVLEGTIEEKVIQHVFSQGTLSSMVLDKSRGIDIKNTTTGKLMGGFMKTSSNLNSRKGALEFGKALLGV